MTLPGGIRFLFRIKKREEDREKGKERESNIAFHYMLQTWLIYVLEKVYAQLAFTFLLISVMKFCK